MDLEVAVIGGDQRQIAVINALAALVKFVKVYGHPETKLPENVNITTNIDEALTKVDLVVLPISGMNAAGMVRGVQVDQLIEVGSKLTALSKGTILLTGSLTLKWREVAENAQLKVIEYAENDEVAIPNAIPTAEGAVQLAMEELPITIEGSTVIVIGFGRVGVAVARIFKALQAKVIVVARRESVMVAAQAMGYQTLLLELLANEINQAQIIINTVPALVINEPLLQKIASDALIIDLASAPGGTDFAAAEKLKLKAILALGLPGKVAPQTAGVILAQAIPKLIMDYLQNGGED